METLLHILKKTESFFRKYGIENPRLDAELLIASQLNCNRMQLYLDFEKPMAEETLSTLRPLVKRRAAHEPLQYILGTAAFLDFELKVDRRCLIPRPETEELMELIFSNFRIPEPIECLDLGTGSGAIACALARHYRESKVTATDVAKETLEIASENVKQLGLDASIRLIESSWFEAVSGTFHLIVSNPPYLADSELEEIAEDVAKFEPTRALSSGPSGMEAIEVLLLGAETFLISGGKMFLEIGHTQGPLVMKFADKIRAIECVIRQDLNGKDRFVEITRK